MKNILGYICCFFAIGGFIAAISGTSDEPPIAMIAICIIFIFVAVLCFTSKSRKQKKQAKMEKLKEGANHCTAIHINGLPLAENVNCNIESAPDKFIFSSGSMKFELEKSKITDMCIRTDKEVQEQYVSSIGGAVGGAVLFGPLGAMIGGRAKKKKVKDELHQYLIITYQSGDIKYIGFEVTYCLWFGKKFVDEFKQTETETTTMTL